MVSIRSQSVYVRKCCEYGQNLDLRAGVCFDDGTREWKNPPVYVANGDEGGLVKGVAENIILLDNMIRNVEETFCHLNV